ncbi:hypothetical protein H2136_18725 [Aeromonas hydrophila]|uniref:Uncharacterized protein n=1 Tax=Aeromonas hydrophila TaxID=644 RepID=A0A926FK87_AERHY|nr:hypothetical protein [Aeromonas hydrophila]
MDELERQKAEIVTRQLQVPPDTPDVHPNIASIYHKRVERFTDALHDDDDGRIAAEELRSLIEEVVLLPGEKRGGFTPSYAASCSAFSTSWRRNTGTDRGS